MKDKFAATWISHTSINDFLNCPRAYFLKNVYKDRVSGNKIQVVSPALSLGSAVHAVLEGLSKKPLENRFKESLVLEFDKIWEKYEGKKGGFKSKEEEYQFKERGKSMLRRVMEHQGAIAKLSLKLKQDFLYYWLNEEDNIILCGKIDWLEYLPETNSLHIIDFKTSKKEETSDSLQLPIYLLLAQNCQSRKIDKVSYWYLEFDNLPTSVEVGNLEEAKVKLLDIGRKIKLARKLDSLKCPKGKDGCFYCRSLEAVLRGEGEKVGESERHDLYYVEKPIIEDVQVETEEVIH